jgi:cytoskeletal protein CcmA (bactofilin family)
MAEAAKDVAAIGEESSFSGKFKGQDLVVLGRFEGEIEVRGRLRVGAKGHAKANVRAATVEVEGELDGDVRCESLSLLPTARVRGTLTAKRLAVQEGALVEGSINPASARPADPPPAPAPAPPAPAPPPRTEAAPGETKPDSEPPK